ncbi:MAG: amidohydrolase family protein [Armatimonadota bacterium]
MQIYKAGIIIQDSERIIKNGYVSVESGSITNITDNDDIEKSARIIDISHCILIPGFVNAHSHIEYSALKNRIDAKNLWDWIYQIGYKKGKLPSERFLYLSSLYGASLLIKSGVTSIGDCSPSGVSAKAIDDIGLRGTVYREIFGQSMGDDYLNLFEKVISDIEKLIAHTSDLVDIGISPHSVYTTNAEVLNLCAESKYPISIHLSETRAEAEYTQYGKGPLQEMRAKFGYNPMTSGKRPVEHIIDTGLFREGVSLVHNTHIGNDEIDLIKNTNAGFVFCPRSNGFLGSGFPNIKLFIDNDLNCALGTDSLPSCLNYNFFEEMRYCLASQRAYNENAEILTAKKIFEMATKGGALVLGKYSKIGSIDKGKKADLVALNIRDIMPNEDIFLYILSKNPQDIEFVMINGEIRAKNGRVFNIEEDNLIKNIYNELRTNEY